MSDRNSVSPYKSRNRHLLNRIRDVLASMQEEAQSCGIPFDPEVATYIWALFHYSYVKDRNPAHFAKPKVQS